MSAQADVMEYRKLHTELKGIKQAINFFVAHSGGHADGASHAVPDA